MYVCLTSMVCLRLLITKLNFGASSLSGEESQSKMTQGRGALWRLLIQEMCDKLESAILEDRRTKVSVLAHELGISEGTVIHIIHEKLHMSKVSSRWVPRMLTPAQKKNRSDICKENLEFSKQIGETFFSQNSNW